MSVPELSHLVDPRFLPAEPIRLQATAEQRRALSNRFALISVDRLAVQLVLAPDGDAVVATGQLTADIVQSCAVSGEDLPVHIAEPLSLRFVRQPETAAEEIELDERNCDEIFYEGSSFDLGEAVAQSLGLAIDPYAVGPDADRIRKEKGLSGEAAGGPFAALDALRKK